MSDGIRTHDRLDHNQELYQLSYAHRGNVQSSASPVTSRLRSRIIGPLALPTGEVKHGTAALGIAPRVVAHSPAQPVFGHRRVA